MWIDTHCHLDADEFSGDRAAVVARADAADVRCIVIPAIEVANFSAVRTLAHSHPQHVYALGIHPMYVERAQPDDLKQLRTAVAAAMDDARFVAIGEIGLDFFVPGLDRDKQEFFYVEQLKIAAEFQLPVLLHVRRSQDALLKQLRRIAVPGGFAHAFNGSFQQAQMFIELGFKLGFGGAMTFDRALQIRRLATQLPLDAFVLETDAPDIAPAWLGTQQQHPRNEPGELARIGAVLAQLRDVPLDAVRAATTANARRALPRLDAFLTAL
ncbi:MAG: TatD family deoxyribonuclease [Burkholderiaceae bacterium]|nr:MAG: TatD family deoxyribonuclease [Burkholderiaceae bacterium]